MFRKVQYLLRLLLLPCNI
ncbi:RepA leader peptide Tap, partial [Yersinia pestis]|nr:RepA leader peptide Tap [Yersinia pestis]MBT8714604.1 RepA leader peptide Tap [Yersinia pestis]